MDELEKEYISFMLKLSDKAKEVKKDFDKLSPQNKERIKNDVSYIAILELLKNTQNKF
ncbi:MAG: hypothetical protein UH851_00595 [Clostridia bacterium]|nr:hypothetical protein [Clostridia bacterium]